MKAENKKQLVRGVVAAGSRSTSCVTADPEEAEKRGLKNYRTTPKAIEHYIDQKNIDLFTRLGIYTPEEMKSHYDIKQLNHFARRSAASASVSREKLRIYGVADNIWVWSKRQGLDPRQSMTGGANQTYAPSLRTISGGITVTF